MKSLSLVLVVMAVMAAAGCKVLAPESARTTLDQADEKMAAADYAGAQALYAEFVNANPNHAQAGRARATQTVLERLLNSQAELDKAKRTDDAPRLRRELADQRGEVDRLKGEVAKLRADLERLRSIDLQTQPGKK